MLLKQWDTDGSLNAGHVVQRIVHRWHSCTNVVVIPLFILVSVTIFHPLSSSPFNSFHDVHTSFYILKCSLWYIHPSDGSSDMNCELISQMFASSFPELRRTKCNVAIFLTELFIHSYQHTEKNNSTNTNLTFQIVLSITLCMVHFKHNVKFVVYVI
jgi:hypothetical protein